jgi:uncharacterized lipoprotein YmbA
MIPVHFVIVTSQDDMQLVFIEQTVWFLKKVKLLRQFLMENFGDLVTSVFVSN